MPDMAFPVSIQAYSESTITSDGASMLLPAEGSIARGKMPYRYGNSDEQGIRAGKELIDPYLETKVSKARGQEVYLQFCFPCHGEKGEGDGPVVMKKFPRPPSYNSARIKAFTKGRIFHVITKGFRLMPSHGSQILERDRWFVAQYIKELQNGH